ncbi:MAG TPA: hypothetical protein VIN11_05125 [Roseivirga sp.]
MRKILSIALFALFVWSCSNNGNGNTGGTFRVPLIVGQTDQTGVTYNSNIQSINFELESQDGDSTFFVANLDLDGNNSNDIVFTLVKWTDNQVLTLRGRNGFEVPFSNSDFEILGTEQVIPGLAILVEGTTITESINNYIGLEDGFVTNTRGNSVSTSSNLSIWNNTVYLPFKNNTKDGWVGINIISNTGVQIDGIGIDVIAIRQ